MPEPDFFELLKALENDKVEYVVIGGIALLINGGAVLTADIDLCIAFERENLNHLAAALNQFQPRLRNGTPVLLDEHAFGGEFVTYFTNVGVIQIINRIQGYSHFQQLAEDSQVMTLKGIPIHVASLKALEKMKTGTGRARDQLHLDIIKSLRTIRGD